jgi:Zn-dependent peptidase ImmA (M78 family)/transcriptional regulator with XRE-family HTH domain
VSRQQVPINPEVLKWTLRESGRSAGELAEGLRLDERLLQSWLAGKERPSATQLRKLAKALKRPTAVFLLPKPPKSAVPQVEFRHAPGRDHDHLVPTERLRLREAGRLQRGLHWVLEELDDDRVRLPKMSASADPETSAQKVRELIGISAETQLGWKSEYEAFREWRSALEAMGVIVLALPMGAESSRGFSAWDDHAPVVAINTHWNARARIFTLFHELGHLLLRTSSICDETAWASPKAPVDPVERWCESFAAALLLPWPDVRDFLRRKLDWDGKTSITSLDAAARIGRAFKVSLRATVLHLINHEVADWKLYRAIPPAVDKKPDGGGGTGRKRPEVRLDEYGRRAARIFMRGLSSEVISRDDVLSYLNIGDGDLSFIEDHVAHE